MSGAALYPDLDKVRFLKPERVRLFGNSEHCFDWERHLDLLVRDHGVRILVDRRGQSHVPLPAHAIDLDMLANRMCRVLTHETQRDHETPESVLALFSAGVVMNAGGVPYAISNPPGTTTGWKGTSGAFFAWRPPISASWWYQKPAARLLRPRMIVLKPGAGGHARWTAV